MVLTERCPDHIAHEQHLERLDGRMRDVEDDVSELCARSTEIEKLIARIDALVSNLQKMYWVLVTAIAGALATSLMSYIQPIINR